MLRLRANLIEQLVYDAAVKKYKEHGSNVKRSELLTKNLIEHLKSNGQKGIVLKSTTGELVPLT